MVELRYVLRSVGGRDSQTALVLQYRKFALGTDASGALTPAGSPGWSDWVDVPTVDEREL